MEFTLTFGAVGDFLAIGVMINDLITILDDARGSAREYRGVVSNLRSLLEAITQADIFYQQARSKGLNLEGLDAVALRTVEQVRQCVDGFLEKLRGFAPSLSNGGSGNKLKDALKKVQWRLEKKEIEAFQSELLSYTGMVQVFMQITTLRLVEKNHQAMAERLDKLEDRNEKAHEAHTSSMQGIMLHVGRAVLSRLSFIAQLSQDLGRSTTQLISLGHAIYGQVQHIQSMMAVFWVDQGITESYFILDDHFGGRTKIFLSNIQSWNSFFCIMSENYKGKKGARRISQRKFVLEQNLTSSEILAETPWEHAFLPRQIVHMSLICRQPARSEDDRSCPRCQTICDQSQDITVTCQACAMQFSRSVMLPEELPTAPGAKPSRGSSKNFTNRHIAERIIQSNNDASDGEMDQGDIAKRRSEKKRRSKSGPKKPTEESDSDEADVAGLARIKILSVVLTQLHPSNQDSTLGATSDGIGNSTDVLKTDKEEKKKEKKTDFLEKDETPRMPSPKAPPDDILETEDTSDTISPTIIKVDQRRGFKHYSLTPRHQQKAGSNKVVYFANRGRRNAMDFGQRPGVHSPRKSPPPTRSATEADAQRHKIPQGYSLKNWDPAEEPILVLGSVFDGNSLGKWIYDWSAYCHGPDAPITEMAGELWLLMLKIFEKCKRAEEVFERIQSAEGKEIMDDYLDAGDRLVGRLQKLLKQCEQPMIRAARQGATRLGKSSGVELIKTLFDRDAELERTERLMAGMRIWISRFDRDCEEILSNPAGWKPKEVTESKGPGSGAEFGSSECKEGKVDEQLHVPS